MPKLSAMRLPGKTLSMCSVPKRLRLGDDLQKPKKISECAHLPLTRTAGRRFGKSSVVALALFAAGGAGAQESRIVCDVRVMAENAMGADPEWLDGTATIKTQAGTFAGTLSSSGTDASSVLNAPGRYGNASSDSSLFSSSYGGVGSFMTNTGACNISATHPPLIVWRGRVVGVLTQAITNLAGYPNFRPREVVSMLLRQRDKSQVGSAVSNSNGIRGARQNTFTFGGLKMNIPEGWVADKEWSNGLSRPDEACLARVVEGVRDNNPKVAVIKSWRQIQARAPSQWPREVRFVEGRPIKGNFTVTLASNSRDGIEYTVVNLTSGVASYGAFLLSLNKSCEAAKMEIINSLTVVNQGADQNNGPAHTPAQQLGAETLRQQNLLLQQLQQRQIQSMQDQQRLIRP